MKAQSDCVYTDFKYFAYTKGGGGGGGQFPSGQTNQ